MQLNQLSPFTGVLDFFSIMLPGFVITLILYSQNWEFLILKFQIGDNFQSFYFNLIFLSISFGIGQILFQLGSLMDELTYDKFSFALFKTDHNLKVIRSHREEQFQLFGNTTFKEGRDQFEHHLNNFKWSLHYLRQTDKDAFIEVEKIIADSKFFRSIFSATILYFLYYAIIHLPSLVSFVFLSSFILYSTIYFYEKSIKKISVVERKELSKLEIDEKNSLIKKRKKKLKILWLKGAILLYILFIVIFLLHGFNGGSAYWKGGINILELKYKYNLPIVIVNTVSLLLYFRIRNKSIRRVYQAVLYNLKLK